MWIYLYPRIDFWKHPTIDIVYTWVQYDSSLQYDLEKYNIHHLKANYSDNNELLYSFKSVEKYAPWFHKIFLVVRDGQRPEWLKNNDRIVIIEHSKIIPKELLPALNSLVIESFIHKIPQLSEKYIYFNDDMILMNHVLPSHFFDSHDLPIETKCSPIEDLSINLNIDPVFAFHKLIQWNQRLLNILFFPSKRYQSQHIPNAYRKSFLSSLDHFLIKKNIQNTFTKKRSNNAIALNSIFKKYWNIYRYHCTEVVYEISYIEITHLRSNKKKIQELKNTSNLFLCIQNSISYEDKNKNIGIEDYKLLNAVLEEKFPFKSRFEK